MNARAADRTDDAGIDDRIQSVSGLSDSLLKQLRQSLQKIDETENYSLRGVLQRYMPQETTADVPSSREATSTVIAASAIESPTTGETLPFSTAVTSTR